VRRIRPRLSYANVISTLALFLVIAGGSAFAATQLAKNSVGTKQLKKNAVTSAKIKVNAVTGAKLGDGAVTGAKLGDSAVTGAKLADSAVTGAKLAAGAVSTGKIADGAVGPEKLAGSYLPTSTPGVPIAGINVSSSGGVKRWFNRAGGEPIVEKEGTGVYFVTFPGLEGQQYYDSSIALVSLISNSGEISRNSNAGNARIQTYNSAGTAADRSFNLVLFVPGGEP
jgi:hypothetical protein